MCNNVQEKLFKSVENLKTLKFVRKLYGNCMENSNKLKIS